MFRFDIARRRAVCAVCVLIAVVTAGCSDDSDKPAAKHAPKPRGPLDGAALHERVIGHTVKGQFGADRDYLEFYAPDGTIHGPGYRAQWHIQDNRLCLDYDKTTPADCYRVRIHGDTLRWLQNGELRGRGRIVEGNPEHL